MGTSREKPIMLQCNITGGATRWEKLLNEVSITKCNFYKNNEQDVIPISLAKARGNLILVNYASLHLS